jgi:hypothetical protein
MPFADKPELAQLLACAALAASTQLAYANDDGAMPNRQATGRAHPDRGANCSAATAGTLVDRAPADTWP